MVNSNHSRAVKNVLYGGQFGGKPICDELRPENQHLPRESSAVPSVAEAHRPSYCCLLMQSSLRGIPSITLLRFHPVTSHLSPSLCDEVWNVCWAVASCHLLRKRSQTGLALPEPPFPRVNGAKCNCAVSWSTCLRQANWKTLNHEI